MKTTNDCDRHEILASYLQGTLSSREEAAAQQHLDRCSTCRRQLEQMAGDGQWWYDAKSLLADMPGEDSHLADSASPPAAPGTDLRPTGVSNHLTEWMGPTDDPTKMGRVGAFEVIGVVGSGGAGVVLKALDVRLNRYVALKVLLPTLAHNAAARKRFERESRAAAAISHQNVVPIYAVDVFNGHPYIAMQYVGGNSLQHRLNAEGPLQVLEVVRIAAQIARALAAAHAQGVIHCDIKPANILLESNIDHVLVTDFGLARVIDEASSHSGMVTGTPQYMSPEQCHGELADQRSDLFSLGSVMYAMCTARPPFRAETLMGLLRKVCESEPRRIRELNPAVPEWLEGIILRLLEKQADRRFPTALAVAGILEAELAHLQNPLAVAQPTRDWLSPSSETSLISTPGRNILMLLVGTLLIGALLWAIPQSNDGNPKIPQAGTPGGLAAAQRPAQRVELPVFETIEQRVFPVRSGGQLILDTDLGNVEVTSADIEKIQVEVIRKVAAANEEEAEKLTANRPIEFISNGTDLTINAKHKTATGVVPDRNVQVSVDEQREVQVEVVHQVVAGNEEEVRQLGKKGRLELVQGDTKLKLDLELNKLHEQAKLRHVKFLVTVPRRYNLNISTWGGNVQLSDLQGTVLAKTGGGNIGVVDVEGSVDARTGGGNVAVSRIVGAVAAVSGGGNVTATLLKQPSKDWLLSTGGGNVAVKLSKELALDVKARTGGGQLRTPFRSPDNKEKQKQKRHIEVSLNGGGPQLIAETGGGNVVVEYAAE